MLKVSMKVCIKIKFLPLEEEWITIYKGLEFAASIRERRDSSISGKDNIHTLAALFATAESSKQGRMIRL